MKPSRGSGDKGETGLYRGQRVRKTHPRVEACGVVDELNSVLGALACNIPAVEGGIVLEIRGVQSALFTVGATLGAAAPSPSSPASIEEITKSDIEALEVATDRIHGTLPRLTGFVIPGGHVSSSWAHLARTVCRRAERRVVAVIQEAGGEGADPRLSACAIYLNRLSDYLFCVARLCNRATGTTEELWKE